MLNRVNRAYFSIKNKIEIEINSKSELKKHLKTIKQPGEFNWGRKMAS